MTNMGIEGKKGEYATSTLNLKHKLDKDYSEYGKQEAQNSYLDRLLGMVLNGDYSLSKLNNLSNLTLYGCNSDAIDIVSMYEFGKSKFAKILSLAEEQKERLKGYSPGTCVNEIKVLGGYLSANKLKEAEETHRKLSNLGADVSLEKVKLDPEYFEQIAQEYQEEQEQQTAWLNGQYDI